MYQSNGAPDASEEYYTSEVFLVYLFMSLSPLGSSKSSSALIAYVAMEELSLVRVQLFCFHFKYLNIYKAVAHYSFPNGIMPFLTSFVCSMII